MTQAWPEINAFLQQKDVAEPWLASMRFADPAKAHQHMRALFQRRIPTDVLDQFMEELCKFLPSCPDPDRVLTNFDRLIERVHTPLSLMTFLLRKRNSLAVLFRLFAASQYFSELMIQSPKTLITCGRPATHRSIPRRFLTSCSPSLIRSVGMTIM